MKTRIDLGSGPHRYTRRPWQAPAGGDFLLTGGSTSHPRCSHIHWWAYDLRHLAATMAAVSGATTSEPMRRMGHSSQRAALIYQHATVDGDPAVAEAMSKLIEP